MMHLVFQLAAARLRHRLEVLGRDFDWMLDQGAELFTDGRIPVSLLFALVVAALSGALWLNKTQAETAAHLERIERQIERLESERLLQERDR